VPDVDNGHYQARVRATNAAGIASFWVTTPENHKSEPPPPRAFCTTPLMSAVRLDWAFDHPTDELLKTEIRYSKSGRDDDTLLIAHVPYPQHTHTVQALAAGEWYYFRARLVDTSGNASAWTPLVSGAASVEAGWIVEAGQDHFLAADTGRQLQEKLEEQINDNACYEQTIAENAQAIEKLNDRLKAIERRIP
jgi:predicted phage tail protein